MKYDTHDGNSIFRVDSTPYPISLMLHDYITYDINMTLLWWMGIAKSRYQFISSSWGLLSMVTPWFVSNIGNTSIRLHNKFFVAFISKTWYYIISCPDFRSEVSFYLSTLLFLQSRCLKILEFRHHHIDVVLCYEKYVIKCYKTL